MGIDLIWEQEDGTSIELIDDPQGCISRLVQATDLTGTVCLRFVDPYGDTTFNQLQIPELLNEVESVLLSQHDPRTREQLRRILELGTRARGQTHTYLKFVGD